MSHVTGSRVGPENTSNLTSLRPRDGAYHLVIVDAPPLHAVLCTCCAPTPSYALTLPYACVCACSCAIVHLLLYMY